MSSDPGIAISNGRSGPKPVWNPYVAGVALGVVLFATFLVTGHGLGITGATTYVTAAALNAAVPHGLAPHTYLAAYARAGLDHWIVWEVVGVILGGFLGGLAGRRLRPRIDGPRRVNAAGRLGFAILGGMASGFGARMAMGCTSGMGLSGSAPLAVAGFVFLVGFFVAGLLAGRAMTPFWNREDAS